MFVSNERIHKLIIFVLILVQIKRYFNIGGIIVAIIYKYQKLLDHDVNNQKGFRLFYYV